MHRRRREQGSEVHEIPEYMDTISSPKWTIRRTLVLIILLWCSGLVTYLAIWGESDELREAIATSVLLLMGMVVSTYVLGVVWNDMSFLKHTGRRRRPYGSYDPYGYSDYPDTDASGQPPENRLGE